jgi:hypothetical protein
MSDLPAPPTRERRLLPVVVVVAVLAVVVFGGFVTAGALSDATGPPVDVGGVVRIHPLSGWELARRFGDPPSVRLTRGGASLDVGAVSFSGTGEELLREYVAQVLEPDADQLSVSRPEPVTLDSGRRGATASYVGTFGDVQTPIEGEVTAVVSGSGVGVVFDGWTPFGLLQHVLGDLRTMIERAEIT